MDKMEILNDIIEENIDWFWNNDPIVSCETNMMKLWDAFSDLDEAIVNREVNKNYSNWISEQIF